MARYPTTPGKPSAASAATSFASRKKHPGNRSALHARHRADRTLQEDFVTIREDRYVVPIVAGQKGRVDGVIHGSSGTGRTLSSSRRNHRSQQPTVRLREDELREIERILAEITESLRAHAPEIAAASKPWRA